MTVSTAPRAPSLALAHAVADHLAAAEFHLFAVDGEVLLDLDQEFRVGTSAQLGVAQVTRITKTVAVIGKAMFALPHAVLQCE